MKTKKIGKYIPTDLEAKWRKKWEEEKLYSPDMDGAKKPFYNLMMFPYPSAEGMHVGNMYAFTGTDVYGRFKRMLGYDVFEPIGLDGFGIHSENYALKIGKHPMEQAQVSEANFYRQLRATGNSYDWARTVETYDPEYYKWTQWLFVKMFEQGLAYRKKATVNFCPSCKTVLADEQVIDGKCERCSSIVEKKDLEQWFFKITDYADRLLNNIDSLNWTEKVKIAQREWIGKKTGINISYQVEGQDIQIVCFTTRPDTNFGATFIVLGPEHPLVLKITTPENQEAVKNYIKEATTKSDTDRIAEGRKKTGVFTGVYVTNNLNGKKLPVWVSDFVLGNVGTGAVVGVPAHDKRDFEFAQTFDLPLIRVVVGKDGDTSPITREEQVQEEEGIMINSQFLDGMDIHKATQKIMDYLEEKGWGKRVSSYHLRDWLISRQRYWGAPIPMIFCEKCAKSKKGQRKDMPGWYVVPEKELPVILPFIEDYKPMGTGKSPLESHPEFYNVACPECGAAARRETDVSDTFLDSAWYFFRYISTEDKNEPFRKNRAQKWLPVNMYIGGAEHSVLHLLYSRFTTMVLKDLGFIDFEEPYARFYAHGLLIKEGHKMSKSKGNVIIPDEYISKFGADTLRCYLMFLGPYNQGGDFYDTGIEGMYRFLQRVWKLIENKNDSVAQQSEAEKRMMHKTIYKVTSDLEKLRYNTAIAILMEYYNFLSDEEEVSLEALRTFLLLLAPFAPHMTEQLWSDLGQEYSIHKTPWPLFDEKLVVENEATFAVQISGKLRDTVKLSAKASQEEVEKAAKESAKVNKHLEGETVKKVIFVPGKIINFVI